MRVKFGQAAITTDDIVDDFLKYMAQTFTTAHPLMDPNGM